MEADNNAIATPDAPMPPSLPAETAQALTTVLQSFAAQFESVHAKLDLIIAAVDEGALQAKASTAPAMEPSSRVAELEKSNQELKAQADRARRKTLTPMVTSLLAKQGVEGDALIETPVIEKALAGLTIEQRIAVKAELARAGVLV
jgi:hypothetical protein